ncbi:Protein of unknown function [Pseudomonas sp. ok272]|uniref:DUF1120 domain-containing protein n=1 Tax=unclassified Pseudomonas TaxID=196821 RepID=UPI0008B91903|nr:MULTISPECIES: DUF1120 domain-containing protein [unclassified Pseudomonas]SEM32197.1 Protein of unknown function [Pseudomonas sp. ok272]SFM32141.1 Protein of unknown function [Pseudomonas sp. ok602]
MNTDHIPRLTLCLALLGLAALSPAPALADECRLSLSQTQLDFGLMNRAIHSTQARERLLGERRVSLTLNCPHPTDMSLFYRGLAAFGERLRFTDRGSYHVQVSDAVLDGKAVELGLLAGSGQAPSLSASTLTWRPEHAIVPLADGSPAQGSSFSAQLLVSAWAQEDAAQVRDAVTWDVSGLIDSPATGRSRELGLHARFAPAACEPTLSNNGVVDFGRMWAKNLNAEHDTALASRSLMLNIGCDGPTHFALLMQDNRHGSATGGVDETAFGLGVDSSANKIGRYYLYFDPVDLSADALPQVYRTDSTTSGAAWSTSSSYPIPIGANSYLGFTNVPGSVAGPTAIQHLSGLVNVRAMLAPMNSLDLSTEVVLDGSGTLEIIYL